MKLRSVYIVSYFLWTKILEISSKNNYYDGLIKNLNEEKPRQVVYILESELDIDDSVMNSLMTAVNRNFPSLIMTYDIINNKTRKEFEDYYYKLGDSTLFILHNKTNKYEDILVNIPLTFKPRILIINSFLSSQNDLNDYLQWQWKRKRSDISILSHNRQWKVMLNDSHKDKVPFISQINCFTEKVFIENLSSKKQWFQNKTHSLYDFNLKYIHIISYSSNKSIYILRRYVTILGVNSCKFVILKTLKHSNDMILSEEFWYLLLGTIGMIFIIRLTAFYMRFERSTWKIFNISQIIIGMSTTREPKKFFERIVFGLLLITCIVYSGYFYSVILDISWPLESEINTLEELANSSLKMIAKQKNVKTLELLSRDNPNIAKIINKVERINIAEEKEYNDYCMRYLTEHQNISCLFFNAENVVNEYCTKKETNVKILDEIVFYNIIAIYNSRFSLYNRHSKPILYAFELGLIKGFYPFKIWNTKILPPENIEKEKLFFVLFRVLAIGYTLSLIFFLIEIFTTIFKRRMYTLYTRFRFVN